MECSGQRTQVQHGTNTPFFHHTQTHIFNVCSVKVSLFVTQFDRIGNMFNLPKDMSQHCLSHQERNRPSRGSHEHVSHSVFLLLRRCFIAKTSYVAKHPGAIRPRNLLQMFLCTELVDASEAMEFRRLRSIFTFGANVESDHTIRCCTRKDAGRHSPAAWTTFVSTSCSKIRLGEFSMNGNLRRARGRRHGQ